MQQAAKGPGLVVLQPVRSFNKGFALFLIEKESLSLLVEKMRSWHFIVLMEKTEIEKAPWRGAFCL